MTSSSLNAKQHMEALEVLRIALCIGIVLYHYYCVDTISGQFAVTGFFVLSGFLLAHSLRFKPLEPSHFYAAKARRLLPTLAASLVLGLVAFFLKIATSAQPAETFASVRAELASRGFSLFSIISHVNVPAWYMAVEITFLIALPLLLSLQRMKYGLTLALFILFACGSFYTYQSPGYGYFAPISHLWQILAGMLCYRLFCRERPQWLCRGLLVLGILLIGASLVIPAHAIFAFGNKVPFCAGTTALFVVLVPLAANAHFPLLRGAGVMRIMGLASALTYGVYLFHWSVYRLVRKGMFYFTGEDSVFLSGLLAVLATLAIAVANKIWWEDKWRPSPRAGTVESTSTPAPAETPALRRAPGGESPLPAND